MAAAPAVLAGIAGRAVPLRAAAVRELPPTVGQGPPHPPPAARAGGGRRLGGGLGLPVAARPRGAGAGRATLRTLEPELRPPSGGGAPSERCGRRIRPSPQHRLAPRR